MKMLERPGQGPVLNPIEMLRPDRMIMLENPPSWLNKNNSAKKIEPKFQHGDVKDVIANV